jgi:hypothetical protein
MRTAMTLTGLLLGPAVLAVALRTPGRSTQAALAPAPACGQLVAPVKEAAPEGCARVAMDDIGRLPLELNVGGQVVRFAEWTATDETQTTLVGFAAQVPEGVVYTVRAGEDVFVAQGSRWLHPAGLVGPKVHGIDEVTFCKLPAPEPGCSAPSITTADSLPFLAARERGGR